MNDILDDDFDIDEEEQLAILDHQEDLTDDDGILDDEYIKLGLEEEDDAPNPDHA